MNISIIGNGFDLRHNLKTSFFDFMKYFEEGKYNKNVIITYFNKIRKSNGWLDFENELQQFLIFTDSLGSSVSYNQHSKMLFINIKEFVTSNNAYYYYETLGEMGYDFISYGKRTNRMDQFHEQSLFINDKNWIEKLNKVVKDDFLIIKCALQEYLTEVTKNTSNKLVPLGTPETKVLKSSEIIVNFNYTKTPELYVNGGINYVHGDLESHIILGIPYTDKITQKEFLDIFKTTQTIDYLFNVPLIENDSKPLNLFFIGFSFGISDHYFFREILDWIKSVEGNSIGGVANVNFYFFYHDESVKSEYINNLREFLGEETLIRFSAKKKVKFVKYGEELKDW